MKTLQLSFIIVLVLFTFSGVSQDCEKEISTNPVAPFNNHPFPSGRYNPWINSDFNVGGLENGNVPPMPLNNQITWQISDFVFGSAFEMWNPYTSAGTPGSRYSYLHPTGMDIEFLDYKWEDGWEVLHIGLGFYPNGESIQTPSAQRAYSPGVNQPSNTRVPYIMLYNRYRGTLRVFMNLFTSFGGYSDILVWLEFDDESTSGLSGILRHLEPFDRPLDQTTNVKRQESYNPNSGGSSRWFSADFQIGYDPCICGKNQKWKISLRGIESFAVSLDGRGVTVELPISDGEGNPNYDVDWLSSNGLEDGLAGGNQIFTKMEGLVEDYKDALDKYEQDSQEYADYLEKKAIMDAFQSFVVDGVSGVIPAGGALKSWFIKPKDGEPGNFASYIKGASKGLLGYGYDQLSMGINPKTSTPKPPDMPTASYSEMRFDGEIEGTSQEETIGPFFIPGSYNETSALSNLDPFNYPAYNAPTGMVALFKFPDPSIYFKSSHDFTLVSINEDPVSGTCSKLFSVQSADIFRLKMDEFPSLVLNPSLDFDMDLSQSLIGIELTIRSSLTAANLSFDPDPESNMSVTRTFNKNGSAHIVLNSSWVPLNLLNQYVFAFTAIDEYSYSCSGYQPNIFDPGCEYSSTTCYNSQNFFSIPRQEIIGLKLKVAHDFYFDQINSVGEQNNTFQIFSYNLFDTENDINILTTDEEDWSSASLNNFSEYVPGILELNNVVITETSPFIHGVVGSTLIINAQSVHISGTISVASNYNVIINALEEISVQPGGELTPRIQLRIKRDFYSTPTFEYADASAASAFCSSSNYQANTPSSALRERIEREIAEETFKKQNVLQSNKLDFVLHPNPARNEVIASLRGGYLKAVTIHDLSGRPLKREAFGKDAMIEQTRMDLADLAPGIYLVTAESGQHSVTARLVVTK